MKVKRYHRAFYILGWRITLYFNYRLLCILPTFEVSYCYRPGETIGIDLFWLMFGIDIAKMSGEKGNENGLKEEKGGEV